MTINRIQFQPGMTLLAFLRCFGTEPHCAAALRAARWSGGSGCQRCGTDTHYVAGHDAGRLFRCIGCRNQNFLTAGSVFEHTELPLTTEFPAT